ncbi:hypothetical protein BDZ90DRAFT_249564 [Jaminaea rosea]|uniref:Protein transport protein BOS1 n=1 Tax=Jaminaea rosea TaxID=1569628 RepID=A0A316UWV7_9BASI|nr:hypothetical protein BDZ90DRAFT_249564 [Jaminaea rosea]PWN29712.1 hypothetical protein BDZ90DRAFT_249564 [Jaminaea rosea]
MAAALYNMALRQASSIGSDLTRLESEPPSSSSCVALQGQIAASLSAFARTVDDYESMSRREMNETKRDKAMARVKKFREDDKEMRSNLARIKNRDPASFVQSNGNGASSSSSSSTAFASTSAASRMPAANLESPFSLHARNNTTAMHNSSQGGLSSDPLAAYKMNASTQAMFGDSLSARENHALREHSFIQNTEQQLDAFIAQGKEVWTNLTEQRDILKGTRRKLLDAANTMGLSRNVINMIERRSTQDNAIFAVGALFTLVCFYYIYKWFG